MSVRITFEVASVAELHSAVLAFIGGPPAAEEEPVRRGRGRPPGSGKKPAAAAADEFPAEPEAQSVPATPPVAATPAPSKATPERSLDLATMRETLITVVKVHGRDACGALCRKHGGPNLSALPEEAWPGLYADAQALLAEPASDA